MTAEQKLEKLNELSRNTLMQTLEIKFTEIGPDFLSAAMPVNVRVHQPYGMLHGGASVALAESLGSCLSNILIDMEKFAAVGTSIQANHLKPKKDGIVTGTAKMIRQGKSLHYIDIDIRDEKGALICHSTMTNMIISK